MRGTGEPAQHLLIIGWRTHEAFFHVSTQLLDIPVAWAN
jgi:hypothetical protein